MMRPDTPLAATPEPMPVNSGQQPMPVNKYQATADAAIQQVGNISKKNIAPAQPQPQPEQP